MGDETRSEFDALKRAIEISGSQSELARAIGVSATSVWRMANKARRMSAGFVLKTEAATGVSRHDLRPDLYPRDLPPAPDTPSAPGHSTPGPSTPGKGDQQDAAA